MPKTTPSRSYGAGAAGDLTTKATKQPRFPLRKRLRRRFDDSLSHGPGAFILWLATFGFIVAIVLTAIRLVTNALPPGSTGVRIQSGLWTQFNGILFNSLIPTGSPWSRVLSIFTWASTITVSASITGFVTSRFAERLARLREGKSPVVDGNHVLVLGWSNRIFPLLQQLAVSNENQRKPFVVIVAQKPVAEMQSEIAARVGDMKNTKVMVRNGDPTSPLTLEAANVLGASSVVVLDADETGDANVIATVLAIKAAIGDFTKPVVAEVDNPDHGEALSHATNGAVISIYSDALISMVTAQASRQPGLASVVLDLLDFEGNEIYFAPVPGSLQGRTYGDALLAYPSSAPIGVATADGGVVINPEPTRVLGAGEQIIALSEDDDTVVVGSLRPDLDEVVAVSTSLVATKPESILVLGWSAMGEYVLTDLAAFLPKRSKFHVIADPRYCTTLPKSRIGGIPTTVREYSGAVSDLAESLSGTHYDEILVLAYREGLTPSEADARTMLTMLLLNKFFDEETVDVQRTRLVAEVLDSRRAELARVANADDLVVSDNLAALMASQLSQNPHLDPVLKDLFDADGAAINVFPAEQYVAAGEQTTFAHLVAAARSRGESAIGYRRGGYRPGDASMGVTLNPAKTWTVTVAPGDGLVVVSGR